MSSSWILLFSCPDVAGVQAFVANFVFEQGGFIDEVKAHSDAESGLFVSRIEFHAENAETFNIAKVRKAFASEAKKFGRKFLFYMNQ